MKVDRVVQRLSFLSEQNPSESIESPVQPVAVGGLKVTFI